MVPPQPQHHSNPHRRRQPKVQTPNIPLNEAAKLELASLPHKTPVSLLQELLSRRGLSPKYDLVQIEGAIHEPIFRYRCALDTLVAMGTGRSKKEAKHNAARSLLDILSGNPQNEALNAIPATNGSDGQHDDEKNLGNPIGWLQEMCMTRRWPPPLYELDSEEGLPHERTFKITCIVSKYREIGIGKSKKAAKRQAAMKMWQTLQETPFEGGDECRGDTGNETNRYESLKDSKITTLSTSHSHKVSHFHKQLKNSTGKKLSQLQTTQLNNKSFNYVQFLQEIASEQQFEVTYVDIEEKSLQGKCQCLVQLSTLPVAVCYGVGNSSKDAQAAAAQNALEYLKIMTKK